MVWPGLKWMIYYSTKPTEIRPGYLSSLGASYTVGELEEILKKTSIKEYLVKKEFFGLLVSGKK